MSCGKILQAQYNWNWNSQMREKVGRNNWRNNIWKISQFHENYESRDPRSSMKLKHMKHKENYTKAHHN